MSFQTDILAMSEQPVKLLATATTGLDSSDDLLAVAVMDLDAHGAAVRSTLAMQRIQDKDKLLKAQQFHGISWDRMMQTGMDRDAFKQTVADLLAAGTVLSYNPGFQMTFLSSVVDAVPAIHNLPLLWKGAETRYAPTEEQAASVWALEKFYIERIGKVPGFKRVCDQAGVGLSDPNLLPVEASCMMLYGIWQKLADMTLTVQGELL